MLVAGLLFVLGFASPAAAQVPDKGADFQAGSPAVSDPVCAFTAPSCQPAVVPVVLPLELARTGIDVWWTVSVGVALVCVGHCLSRRRVPC